MFILVEAASVLEEALMEGRQRPTLIPAVVDTVNAD